MSAHRVLILLFEHSTEERHSSEVLRLSEAVGELVLEEGGRGSERCGDSVNGGDSGGRRGGGEVLEGEEGAEALSEEYGFVGEDFAEG